MMRFLWNDGIYHPTMIVVRFKINQSDSVKARSTFPRRWNALRTSSQRERTETHLIRRQRGKYVAGKRGTGEQTRAEKRSTVNTGSEKSAGNNLSGSFTGRPRNARFIASTRAAASKGRNSEYFEDYENGGLIQRQLPSAFNKSRGGQFDRQPARMKRDRARSRSVALFISLGVKPIHRLHLWTHITYSSNLGEYTGYLIIDVTPAVNR